MSTKTKAKSQSGKNGSPTYAVEMRHVATVKPYPANAKVHSEAAVEKLASLIQRFGFRVPIVVDHKSVILKGHRTFRAALALGMTSVPVHVAAGLSASEAKAWRLADNRVGQDSGWDDALLRGELGDLQADGFDLTLTGFGKQELADLLGTHNLGLGHGGSEEISPPPINPITQPGDLIHLGAHRLLCGDSTYLEQADRLMQGEKAAMVFTDPPYGVNVTGKGGEAIAGDISFTAIPLMFATLDRVLARGAWLYVCGGQSNMALYSRLFEHHFRQLPRLIVWHKGKVAVMRHNGYHSCYELIYYTFKLGGGDRWYAGRKAEDADDVWLVPTDTEKDRQHVTQKPIEVPARAIRNSCPPGGLVYDPFGGSGSTLLAAEQTGRRSAVVELSPAYCDVIVTRWEQATGQTAQRPGKAA